MTEKISDMTALVIVALAAGAALYHLAGKFRKRKTISSCDCSCCPSSSGCTERMNRDSTCP